MKYKIYKIVFLMIFVAFFLIGFSQVCFAQQKLNINYPEIQPGVTITGDTELPQIIRYIYLFGLGIVGFVALLSMLIGAIRYIFSAGNPSKAGDAKDQIFSAILGILILLASVLILRTINPDLVNIGFKLPEIVNIGGTSSTTGVQYRCICICQYGAGLTIIENAPSTVSGFSGCQSVANEDAAKNRCNSACGSTCRTIHKGNYRGTRNSVELCQL